MQSAHQHCFFAPIYSHDVSEEDDGIKAQGYGQSDPKSCNQTNSWFKKISLCSFVVPISIFEKAKAWVPMQKCCVIVCYPVLPLYTFS